MGRRGIALGALFAVAVASAAPKITQFWAVDPNLPRGEATRLCYGVEDASAVRIEPDVKRLYPALTHCFEVAPQRTTTYKLIAQGADGSTAMQSVVVRLGPPRARIIEVSVNKLQVVPGERVVVCYKAQNAISAEIHPGKYITTRSPQHACVDDQPRVTTAYTVTITGAGNQKDTEKVTVRVR
jgi:hypothetical protein